ncbi:methyltransferase [Arcanobacterium haemolyticum]|nr:methyltransferase [Arcanobacterium haemolyticum]
MTNPDTNEELRRLRGALRASEVIIGDLREKNEQLEKDLRLAERKLAGAWEQLETLRHSTSWKLTAPVRVFKSTVRKGLGR